MEFQILADSIRQSMIKNQKHPELFRRLPSSAHRGMAEKTGAFSGDPYTYTAYDCRTGWSIWIKKGCFSGVLPFECIGSPRSLFGVSRQKTIELPKCPLQGERHGASRGSQSISIGHYGWLKKQLLLPMIPGSQKRIHPGK